MRLDSLALERCLSALEERFNDLEKSADNQRDEAQRQVSSLKQQLEAERDIRAKDQEAAYQQLKETRQQLEVSQLEAKQARKEVESTLRQLHQVQEELERYFILHRENSEMLSSSQGQVDKVLSLLSGVISSS